MASSSSGNTGSSQMRQKFCMSAGIFRAAALDTKRLGECLYLHGVLSNSIIWECGYETEVDTARADLTCDVTKIVLHIDSS
jgi:hypothetical protein